MAISALASEGPYFASGQIKFSDLRSTFAPELANNNIKASTYRRNTTFTKIPVVPDSIENSDISSGNDLSILQFRNSIKSLSRTQSSSDTDIRIDNLWSGNENKNIPKYFYVNGTVSQGVSSNGAARVDASVFNLKIVVSGAVLGRSGENGVAGGAGDGSGGSKVGTSGVSGGTAFYINSSIPPVVNDIIDGVSYRNYPVDIINNGGIIYAGGGGGGGGRGGGNGANGTCSFTSEYWTGSACGSTPSCGGAQYLYNQDLGGCRCRRKRCRARIYRSRCLATGYYEVRGGYGGAGGAGADGRGSDYAGSLVGANGSPGETPFCNVYYFVDGTQYGSPGGVGSYGGTGEKGGDSGDWGSSGQGASGTSGGTSGFYIFSTTANSTTLSGSTGSGNIKGRQVNVVTP